MLRSDNNQINDLIVKFEEKRIKPKNSHPRRYERIYSLPDETSVFLNNPQFYQQGDIFYDSMSDIPTGVQILYRRPAPQDSFPATNHNLRFDNNDQFMDEYDLDQQTTRTTTTKLTNRKLVNILSRVSGMLEMISRLPLPRMSVTGMGLCCLVAIFFFPRACSENLLYPGFRLLFGTLYPAYASYKAVRTKNVKEYVKWMMYWIVLAFFTCIETFTDIFLAWFPFYYEVKVILVIWLLSPATKGSSTLYRKFVHPMLTKRENEIDEYLNQAKEKGYTTVLQLGSKGVNYATNVIMQTAIKGGGNLVQTLRRSYSLSDLSEPDTQRTQDEIDEIIRPQRALRSRTQSTRSSSGGRQQVEMYFAEVDVTSTRSRDVTPNYNYIRSSEDISSGYSSAEPVSVGLSRTASMTNASRTRARVKKTEEGLPYVEEGEAEIYYPNYPCNEIRARVPINPYPIPPFIPNCSNLNVLDFEDENLIEKDIISRKITQKIDPKKLNIINELKDEEYFENEKYFQKEEPIFPPLPFLGDDTETKYKLFCQWLETQKNFKQIAPESQQSNENIINEDFKDTITEPSDDVTIEEEEDEFHEIEDHLEQLFIVKTKADKIEDLKESKETNIETMIVDSSIKNVVVDKFLIELPTILNEVTKEEIQINNTNEVNLLSSATSVNQISPSASQVSISTSQSGGNSVSDLTVEINIQMKKPASHNKGKAPEPPSNKIITDVITVPTSSTTDLAKIIDKKSKKNILTNYLPGLFKTETSSSTNPINFSSSPDDDNIDDTFKETAI